jgi:hypothetical protein
MSEFYDGIPKQEEDEYDGEKIYRIYICSFLKTTQNIDEVGWNGDSSLEKLYATACGISDALEKRTPDHPETWKYSLPSFDDNE